MAEHPTVQVAPQGCVPKAVIFTHLGSLKPFDSARFDPDSLTRKYGKFLKPYLECNRDKHRISIVYVYVDMAIKKALPLHVQEDNGRATFQINALHLQADNQVFGLLSTAEQDARPGQ